MTDATLAPISDTDLELILQDLMLADDSGEFRNVRTFSDDGVLTQNRGLVLHMRDGAEFQLTIVRSR